MPKCLPRGANIVWSEEYNLIGENLPNTPMRLQERLNAHT